MLLVFGELYAELTNSGEACLEVALGGPLLRQALAARAAGARTRFLGRVGRDGYGRSIRRIGQHHELEWALQEDGERPTSLWLGGDPPVAYRAADAHLEPPAESFFEGGRVLHAGAWAFGMDPARTTAAEVFREGLHQGLALSLDLRSARWALRADLEEVLRPFLPLAYMKADAEALEALELRPGELFQWANTVLLFAPGKVRRMTLFEEEDLALPAGLHPDEAYGRFLAGASRGREPEAALAAALEGGDGTLRPKEKDA
ncbi:hypothetical protein [Oceanithermus desulfurans]|uniref:Carbohydrate kinase PfkB domain-containing protein n=2 Tax=Oceanithermus desulfurans TaxID=227924 RepID=A0A511RM05_9DEIN|nr:hypothetical protein [Oceanithermus desulfurans]MBB6029943.1 sugar/nucleoside kinase (ribokinase family) [Oceanithermus desulfurans]GEM90688.1 hypothetical protein ODE01S_21220 [Oceanithermus desulfurans NBRC 100063]